MTSSFKLGRIFGIPIAVNYTWFIIFVMITLSLATYYFPSRYPYWGSSLYWALGILTSLLFFASVLIHELAHSLVSKAQGIPVHRITLFLFGGVASIAREAASPLGEFIMALAGPVSSLIVAFGFGVLWIVGRILSEPLAALAGYLALINLSLALFNLIPGFPLDGGRLLRSFIWGVTGNYRRATEVAINLGRVVALLFILGGLGWAVSGHWADGLWLAFIGWFLENAATQSYRQMVTREALRGVTVGELMSRECPLVPPSISLEQLVYDYILPRSLRCFFVSEGDEMRGLVTMHHIKGIPREKWAVVTVESVMTPIRLLTKARVNDDALEILEKMDEEDINQMPVMEGDRLVGLIRRDHLLHFIRTRLELGI